MCATREDQNKKEEDKEKEKKKRTEDVAPIQESKRKCAVVEMNWKSDSQEETCPHDVCEDI